MQNEVFEYVTPLLYHLKSCAKHQRSVREQSRWASSSHIINKGVRNHRWLIIKYVYADKWSEENAYKIRWWKELTTSGWIVKQGLSVKNLLSWNLNDKKPDIWISREGAFQGGRASNTNALEFPGTEKHVTTTKNEEKHRDKASETGRGQVVKGPASRGKWFEIYSEALLEGLAWSELCFFKTALCSLCGKLTECEERADAVGGCSEI